MTVCKTASLLIVLAIEAFAATPRASADMIIFHNGERRYGTANYIPSSSDVVLTTKDYSKRFSFTQIREVVFGVDKPEDQAAKAVASATNQNATEEFIPFTGGDSIYDVTGGDVYRKKMSSPDGKEFILDVEDKFDVPTMKIYPTTYSFYNRQGVYLILLLTNREDLSWRPLEMRVKLYDEDDNLIASKDAYVFRLPGAGQGSRVIEMQFPDVIYDRVKRIRVMRKY
ncbi:MAG: hypothetical protein GC154_17405 [bacterium]|nr:hypothetical protein [bacterium]